MVVNSSIGTMRFQQFIPSEKRGKRIYPFQFRMDLQHVTDTAFS